MRYVERSARPMRCCRAGEDGRFGMSDRTTSARRWAREVSAQLLAEQVQLAKANEEDLLEFQKNENRLARAVKRRDTAIAAAIADYDTALAQITTARSAALRRLRDRGMDETQLHEVTGVGVGVAAAAAREQAAATTGSAGSSAVRPPGNRGR